MCCVHLAVRGALATPCLHPTVPLPALWTATPPCPPPNKLCVCTVGLWSPRGPCRHPDTMGGERQCVPPLIPRQGPCCPHQKRKHCALADVLYRGCGQPPAADRCRVLCPRKGLQGMHQQALVYVAGVVGGWLFGFGCWFAGALIACPSPVMSVVGCAAYSLCGQCSLGPCAADGCGGRGVCVRVPVVAGLGAVTGVHPSLVQLILGSVPLPPLQHTP
jgi:hypothetical protein